jgi:hypothetical protein
MVAYADDPKLERGMLMSITRDGTLDSIARGGWKRRGGKRDPYRFSSTDPQIVHHFEGRRCLVYSIPSSRINGTVVEWIHALE